MGPGSCFLQAAFLTPKCLCAIKGFREHAKCLPPPHLLHPSPQSSSGLLLSSPSPSRAPPTPGKVRALDKFHHTQMQSESLSGAPC